MSVRALPDTGNGGVRGKATNHFHEKDSWAGPQPAPPPALAVESALGRLRPLPTRTDLCIKVVCKH